MRRIALRGPASERGASAIIVAICMVALLGFAALVIDLGRVYAERAQLQSGADAIAIGAAQTCARQPAPCTPNQTVVEAYANANTNDSTANAWVPVVDQTNRTIKATVGAKDGGTTDSLTMSLAQILGIDAFKVTADSKATWGSPYKGTTPFPIAFSVCQVEGYVDGTYQLLQAHGSNANPDCKYGPSGQAVEGGFGWLVQETGKCGGFIDLAVAEGGSAPGNSAPPNCTDVLKYWIAEIEGGRPPVVLLPVFSHTTGTGSGASYSLVSFAAFEVAGWKFTGNDPVAVFRSTTQGLKCEGDCRGIIGKFKTYVSLAEGYTLGPVQPHGATVVQLTN